MKKRNEVKCDSLFEGLRIFGLAQSQKMDVITFCRNMLNLFFVFLIKDTGEKWWCPYILKSERPGGGSDLCGGGSLYIIFYTILHILNIIF